MTMDSKSQKILTSVTLAFTILLPLLYVCGFAYESGYLFGYGINNDLFPKSVPEYLTSSLLFFISTGGISAKYLITAIAIIVVGFILFAAFLLFADYISDVPVKTLNQFYLKIKPHLFCAKAFFLKFNFKILARPAKLAFIIFFVFYSALVLMLFTSIMTYIPYLVGKKVASDLIKRTKLCSPEKPAENCVSLLEYGNVIASGSIVAKSDKFIALYNDNKTTIYSLKEYDIAINKTIK